LTELENNVYPSSTEIAESVDPHWALVDTIGDDARVGWVMAVCSEGDNSVNGAGMALAVARVCGIDVGNEPKAPIPGTTYIGPWRVPRSWEGAFGLREVSREMFS
jgi:proteasome assembly chaperone 2